MNHFILYIIGYLILKIRYPNKEKRNYVLKNIYDNDYINAGSEPILKTIAIALIILLFIFLISTVYAIFKHGPTTF